MLKDPELLRSQAYIDGVWTDGDDAATFAVLDPATGEMIASVPDLGATETKRAIDAADAAFQRWRWLSAKDRSLRLKRWHSLMIKHQEDLALLITLEQGKPLAEARGEISYGASFVEWFAEEAKRVYGDLIPSPAADKRMMVIKQPVGVTAAITPWNFPVAMITRKVAPALAAGCTCVVKPDEATPLSALALAELANRAGIPPGVFNVVTTARPRVVGRALTSSSIVRKLSFTGSTAVGRRLLEQCAWTVKNVSMELAGNAPFIVFEDANLDLAVQGAIASKFRNAGQTCVCSNRLLVHESVYDRFASRLVEAARCLKIGSGFEPDVQIGPLIDEQAKAKVKFLVDEAVSRGAKVLLGGDGEVLDGNFFPPTVLVDASQKMALARDEIFGPVAPLFRFKTEEEAIEWANGSDAGLAAYVFTEDMQRAWRVSERLDFGMIGLNDSAISNEVAPFGGFKESSIGREGSRHGIDEYLELKYICQGAIRS